MIDQTEVLDISSFSSLSELNEITRKDIHEIKTLSRPPHLVFMVIQSVFSIQAGINRHVPVDHKGNLPKQNRWTVCKSALRDHGYLIDCCSRVFDKVGTDPVLDRHVREVGEAMKPYSPETVKNVSAACYSLALWIKEVVEYEATQASKL